MRESKMIGRMSRLGLALCGCACLGRLAGAQETAPEQEIPAEEQTLAAVDDASNTIVVTGRQRSVATDVMQERIELPVVSDLLGNEQISRVGDSSVSLALRRLPGVTLVNDQFIYVRGLGERYSSTTLNGAYVPSPDLTRNVIPLDLFPAAIIDSLAVLKGYSPDMPAAFGGGAVDIRTRNIPDAPLFSFEIGSGWNSQTRGKALTYAGGGDDWLGSDDGTRALPGALGSALQTYRGNLTPINILDVLHEGGGTHSLADAQQINRQLATSLNRNLDFKETSPEPDISAQLAAGRSWYLGEGEAWRFGVLGLADYGNEWRNKERVNSSQQFPETTVRNTRQSTQTVSLTGSLNLGIEYAEEHRLELSGLYLRDTDDEVELAVYNNNNFARVDGLQLREYRIRYEERELELYQIRGTHTLGESTLGLLSAMGLPDLQWARELSFSWYFSDALATTDVPGEALFSGEDRVDPQSGALLSTALRASNTAADYRFTELQDEVRSYGWSLSKPLEFGAVALTASGGWERYEKGRSYAQTQFGLGSQALGGAAARAGTPGQVLTDDNILDPANDFLFSVIRGSRSESYLAGEIIEASYGMVDVNWAQTWRLLGGVRYESFERLSLPIDPLEYDVRVGKILVPTGQLSTLAKFEDDYYPALALTYMRPGFWADEFQLRFGWSQTVARPDLREISAATYIDPLTDARVSGNPNLLTAGIDSFDLRGEWFFASGDSLTATAFYKTIDNPIETVQGAGSDDIIAYGFINAESAKVYGLELEWLKGDPLGRWGALGRWTDDLFFAGNITVSDSEIVIGSQALNATRSRRPLSQHSPHVANLQFGYDAPNGRHSATLVYNVFGKRIFFAGVNGAPDGYEQPFDSLDLVYSFYPTQALTLKLRLQNILDENLEIRQGGVPVLRQDIGATFKLDATMKF